MAIASNVPIAPVNERRLRDYNYIANVALGGVNTRANTAALDLVQPQWQSGQTAPVTGPTGPYSVTERFWVQVQLGDNSASAVIQHTGALANGAVDTGNYANISELAVMAAPTTAANYVLPPTVKRFIRLQCNGGATTATGSMQLLF